MIDYSRQILALDDDALEKMVREWVAKKTSLYVRVERFSGTGDKGRDVVGFATTKLHEGPWDNYQCKQYGRRNLTTGEALIELGKIFFFAAQREFSVPRKCYFVAPRGVNRNLRKLLFKPTEFRQTLVGTWDQHCGPNIIESGTAPLTSDVLALIQAYDFVNVQHLGLDSLIADANFKPVLFKWFGADPGPAPKGKVPAQIGSPELPYVSQLVDAYGERSTTPFASYNDIEKHTVFGPHLILQRERFFDADAFLRFYRDNTTPETIEDFNKDIYHGIIDTHAKDYPDSLSRVDAVMSQASIVQPSGPLSVHARVPVKQGVCHHFANDDTLKWKK